MTNWKIVPFHTLFHRLQKRTGFPDEELLSVYRDYGVIHKSDRDDNFNRPGDLSDYQLVERGDLVLNKMKTWQGSLGISPHRGIVSPAYFVYKPVSKNDERFLHYALRCRDAIDYYASHSTGIRVNQWDLNPEWLDVMPVALPDIETQRRIADYLDKEISEMNELIENLEELVKNLEERKSLLIDDIIYNSKDEIKLAPLGLFLAEPITDGPHETPEFIDEGIPFLSVDGIQNGELVFDNCRFISQKDHDRFSKKAKPRKNDILMGKAASTGKIALVKTDREFNIWSPLAIIRPNNNIDPRWLTLVLKSPFSQRQINDLSTFNTQKNIAMGDIPRLKIPVINLNDQKEVADHLDKEIEYMDSLIDNCSKLIELLKERKTVLISEVVAGRKEV